MIVVLIALFEECKCHSPSLSGIITLRESPGVWLLRDARQGAPPSNVSNPVPIDALPETRIHDHRAAFTARAPQPRVRSAHKALLKMRYIVNSENIRRLIIFSPLVLL